MHAIHITNFQRRDLTKVSKMICIQNAYDASSQPIRRKKIKEVSL